MQWIAEYLLSITAASVICVVAKNLIGEKSTGGKLVRLVSGVVMAITLVSPVISVKLEELDILFDDFQLSAEQISQDGVYASNQAMGKIISDKVSAYILSEANKLSVSLDVVVELADEYPPTIGRVVITGDVSPYKKQVLCQNIKQNLGLSGEQIQWT